jgi:hypothetical protein
MTKNLTGGWAQRANESMKRDKAAHLVNNQRSA